MKRTKCWLEMLLSSVLVLSIFVELFAPARWSTFLYTIAVSISIVYLLVFYRVPPEQQLTATSIWLVLIYLILAAVYTVLLVVR